PQAASIPHIRATLPQNRQPPTTRPIDNLPHFFPNRIRPPWAMRPGIRSLHPIEDLICHGHLDQYIMKPREPSLRPKGPVERQVDVIVCGPVVGGVSSSARKAYSHRTASMRNRLGKRTLRYRERSRSKEQASRGRTRHKLFSKTEQSKGDGGLRNFQWEDVKRKVAPTRQISRRNKS
ncbi:hypothetical protein BHE74_00048869, partial [Ensete ventricosum]